MSDRAEPEAYSIFSLQTATNIVNVLLLAVIYSASKTRLQLRSGS